jgi:hypothetical protein
MRPAAIALLCGLALLPACAPPSPEVAALRCEERARAARGPTGEIAIGVGTGGPISRVEVGVTGDYLAGRDPYQVYDACVRQMTGQPPIRPLVLTR